MSLVAVYGSVVFRFSLVRNALVGTRRLWRPVRTKLRMESRNSWVANESRGRPAGRPRVAGPEGPALRRRKEYWKEADRLAHRHRGRAGIFETPGARAPEVGGHVVRARLDAGRGHAPAAAIELRTVDSRDVRPLATDGRGAEEDFL